MDLSGHGKPDWHDDASTFDGRTLLNLVEHVDALLRAAPSLTDMALLAGVSPGHFAKDFRQSTGSSLGRFINHRRILRSLQLLKADAPVASIAPELGVASQSHFTRTFSGLSGMAPARYGKLFRRIVG